MPWAILSITADPHHYRIGHLRGLLHLLGGFDAEAYGHRQVGMGANLCDGVGYVAFYWRSVCR